MVDPSLQVSNFIENRTGISCFCSGQFNLLFQIFRPITMSEKASSTYLFSSLLLLQN